MADARGAMRLAAIVLPLAVACGGGGRRALTTRADSAGVEIVSYAGADVSLDWRFDSLFALGGAESGPQSFYELRGGAVGADSGGRLFVLDASAKRIAVFDSSGGVVRLMGKPGGGPGELQWPIALVVTQDGRSAAVDIGKRALVWFASDGAALEQTPMPPGFMGGGMYATANALIYPSRAWGDGASEGGRSELIRAALADTTKLVSVPMPPGKTIQLPSCGMGFTGMTPIFTPEIRWAASGDRIAYVTGAEYEVTLAGMVSARLVRRPLEPERATEQAALADQGSGMRVSAGGGARVCKPEEVVRERGYADRIPIITEIAAGPDDTWWVRRRNRGGVDVFAEDGEYLGTLAGSAPYPVITLPGHRIATIATDSLDVERLVVYQVHTGKS
jgi:hypothetical protein